jgi:uncharacterized membrane protein YbhN (UPF0104 family)
MALILIALMRVLHSRRWHDRVPAIIRKHVFSFVDGFRAVQSLSAAVKTLALSLLIWLSISAQIWCFLRAYLDVFPVTGALLIVAITVVGVAIPTPGGVGGFQYFMNLSLIHFFRPYLSGADTASQAAGISNGVYILSMVPVILVGFILMHREGLSLGRAAELSANQARVTDFRTSPAETVLPKGPHASTQAPTISTR